MSGDQPIPPSRRRQAHLLRTQNKFWDFINSIELPIIIFMQKHFKAYSSTSFWNSIAKIASASNIRLFPMLLYSLGFEEKARYLALSLVYFSLFSSFGKYLIVRRRPGSYEGVHSPACASTSSFPSRHTISITIVAFFLPFTWIWIFLIIMSRIMLGMHFLTDCILGVFVGKLALFIAPLNTDPNFCLFLLLVTFRVWSGAYKILSGSLPFLILTPLTSLAGCSSFIYSPLCVFFVLIWRLIRKLLPPAKVKNVQKQDQKLAKKSDKSGAQAVVVRNTSAYELLVIELIPISFVVLLISEANKLLFCIRQFNFETNNLDTSCVLCESTFSKYICALLSKYSAFRKLLSAVKSVDVFSINLKNEILSFKLFK